MAKRKPEQEQIQTTLLKKPKEVFLKEIQERISSGKELLSSQITTMEQLEKLKKDYSSWDDYNEELLKRSFNIIENEYYHAYQNCNQWIGVEDVLRNKNTRSGEYRLKHEMQKIEASIANLENLQNKIPLIDEVDSIGSYSTIVRSFTNNCFIVHGHNEVRKLEVARFIENDLHKHTFILHEQPNKGRTIIEKFIDYSEVDFAVALWTADDEGKADKEVEYHSRARQNVIFETGFFIGKLGRENVIVLYEDRVEIPSDYSGVIFIRLADNWKDSLRKEINAIYEY